MHHHIRRAYIFAALLFLAVGTAITVILSQQSTDLRQRAAETPGFFPFGIFTDSGYWKPSGNFVMSAEIDTQLIPHNLNSIMFTNGTPDLTAANSRNFPVIAALFYDAYRKWFEPTKWGNPEPPLTIESARSIFQPIIDTVKNNSSIIGYNIVDDAPIFPREKVRLATQVYNEYDPARFSSPMLIGYDSGMYKNYDYYKPNSMIFYNYPYNRYNDTCQTYATLNPPGSTAVYPPTGVKDMFMQNREFLQYKANPTQPAWIVLQTDQTIPDNDDGHPSEKRYPTVEEIRLENWLSLASGVNGIFWFTYEDTETGPIDNLVHWQGFKNNPAFYTEIGDLGRRVKLLATTLNSIRPTDDLFSTNVLHDDAAVRTFKSKTQNVYYVMVVNNNCSNQTITINSDYFGGSIQDLETGTVYPLGSSLSFRAGDGKLFQLVNGTIKPTPTRTPNLLTNASFEQQTNGFPTGWTNWPYPGTKVLDTTVAHTGTTSFRVDGPSSGDSFISQKPTMKPNTVYKIVMWTKSDRVAEPDSWIGFSYTQELPSGVGLASGLRNAESGWVKTENFFKTPSDITRGRFDVFWKNLLANQQGWFDDAVLCEYTGKPCDGETLEPISLDATTPAPTSVASPTPTPIPSGGTTATKIPHWNTTMYSQTVEQWWASHFYNPANPNRIAVGGINDGTAQVNVCNFKSGSDTAGIAEALATLPTTGGTLFFPKSCSPYTLTRALSWEDNQYPQTFAPWGQGGANLDIKERSNLHFVSDDPTTVIKGRIRITSMGYRRLGRFNPVRNFYFKNLTFENAPTRLAPTYALVFEDAEDILVDNVKFVDNGMMSIINNNNIWVRNSIFEGGSGLYYDGGQGVGAINSTFSNAVGSPNVLTTKMVIANWTNMDGTSDSLGNRNGVLDPWERRTPRYQVFSGNTFSGGVDTLHQIIHSGQDILINNNTIIGPYGYVLWHEGDPRPLPNTSPAEYFDYYNFFIRNNTITNVPTIFYIRQPRNSTTNAILNTGKYEITNNVGTGITKIVDKLSTDTITPPEIISGNCINGKLDLTATPCTGSATPTPTGIGGPIPTSTPTRTPTPIPTTSTATPTSLPQGTNLLLNSSMENVTSGDPSNWASRATNSWDNTVAHTGVASMKTVPATDGFYYSFQNTSLIPGKTYTMEAWVKTSNVTGTGAYLRYTRTSPSPAVEFDTQQLTGTNDWTKVTKTFTVPADQTGGRFDITWNFTGGTAWFDDVALCEGICGSTPTVPPTSPTSPTSPPPLTGDINRDGRVDLLDFNIWRDEFLGNATTKQSDLNNDGKVDLLDYNIWLTAYKGS